MRLPIEIFVRYTSSEEMEKMAQKSRELMQQLIDMREQRDRAEYRYRCECMINLQLQDLLDEHGIEYRAALQRRPWDGDSGPGPPKEKPR